MPSLQTRIELPSRKPGRSRRTEKVLQDIEEPKTRTSSRSKSKAVEPIQEPEKVKESRGRPRKNVPDKIPQSPVKRPALAGETSQECGGLSPTKLRRTPAKTSMDSKENLGCREVLQPPTPSTYMARLALTSPRQPLGEKTAQTKATSVLHKGPLFSPQKMTVESIASLLDSPLKSQSRVIAPRPTIASSPATALFPSASLHKPISSHDLFSSPVKASQDSVFRSPLKPVRKIRTPAKSPSKTYIHPNNSHCLPSASPKRITVNQLEDLLCSPVKSPLKSVTIQRSPRKPLTPAKLSASPLKRSLFSPVKAPAPALFKADVSQFQTARAALHTGTPTALLCRDAQVETMSVWLDLHLVAGRPGSIYVSGAPGTGKTATLVSLLSGKVADYRSIFINCMVLKSAIAIYREVAQQLRPKSNPKTEKAALKVIEEAITNSKEMTLLVLDEVDQLESKDQSVLYTVFEWPALQGSRMALVGIANSLDLTDRVLPRLKVKAAYKPTLLHYPPYTKQQLIDILTARLREGSVDGSTPVITPRAIAFLASKISSLSGDLRKALDVCRRALELAEGQVRKQSLLKPMTPKGLANPLTSPRKGYKNPKVLPQIGQVDLPQILKVVNQVYGSQVSANLGTKGEGLPVQQKILIASLLLMVKKGRTKEVTLGKLIDTYCNVLKKRNMKPELESACVGMIEMFESRGMVTYLCKGAPRMAKVSLRMDEDEVDLAFGDKAMLGAIIEDVCCIAK